MVSRPMLLMLALLALLAGSAPLPPLAQAQSAAYRVALPFLQAAPRVSPLRQIATLGGGIYTFAVADGFLYVDQEQALRIYRIDNLVAPTPVGRLPLDSAFQAISVNTTTAWLVDGFNRLLAVDLRDRAAPRLQAVYDDLGFALTVVAREHRLYVATTGALLIFDASDPANLQELGRLSYAGSLQPDSMTLVGDRLYLTRLRSLAVIDVRDPAVPREIGAFPTNSYAESAFVGNVAYLADRSELRIVDFSNPAAPQLLGELAFPGESAFSIALGPGVAYLGTDTVSLRVIDVRNPAAPQEAGRFDTPDGNGGDIVAAGDVAFVADGFNGQLHTVLATNPAAPARVGGIATPIGGTYDVLTDNGRFFVTEGDDLVAQVNVQNSAAPQLIGRSPTATGCALALAVGGDYAYVAGIGGLQVLDFTNPAAPFARGRASGQFIDLAVADGIAYGATLGGMRVIDVRNPDSPTQLGVVSNGNDQNSAIAVANGRAYVVSDTAREAVLRVYDVRNPAAPQLLGSYGETFPDGVNLSAEDVVVQGNLVYLAGSTRGLIILDASDPAAIRRIGQYDVNDIATGIYVEGDRAFLAGTPGGLRVIDISNPAAPRQLLRYSDRWRINRISGSNGTIYLATIGRGVQIFQYDRSNPDA